jgi:hypothetical protein
MSSARTPVGWCKVRAAITAGSALERIGMTSGDNIGGAPTQHFATLPLEFRLQGGTGRLTIRGPLAQPGRALARHARGQKFKSSRAHNGVPPGAGEIVNYHGVFSFAGSWVDEQRANGVGNRGLMRILAGKTSISAIFGQTALPFPLTAFP